MIQIKLHVNQKNRNYHVLKKRNAKIRKKDL
jgi:hypothetical protein